MSIADALRVIALEEAVAGLLDEVAALRARVAEIERESDAPAQRPQSAPADDPLTASVVEALEAGQSIRGAAKALNLDRNKVARLRQRAIAKGCLTCLAPIETSRGAS